MKPVSNFASISELNPEYKPEIVMFPNANFGKYLHIALFDYVSKFRGKCYFVKLKKRTFVGCSYCTFLLALKVDGDANKCFDLCNVYAYKNKS